MPPTLTSKPTEAFLGGSKRFKCQVIGNPRPVIRWFKDGVDITTNPRYSFDFTMEGRISMVIPNVTYKDEGCYRCRAENSEGIASTASYLMVRGSVQEQRDEIPSADVAEMEIEEVYIKHRDEDSYSEEMSRSAKKRTEKKDRWKSSELEVTEEFSSSSTSFQRGVTFESSQSESIMEESKHWQIETESNVSTKSESESGFMFDGQSMVIESQVFGKSQEMLAELESDPSGKMKPIFVDNRKRPSDELEVEDVIELVIREEEKSESQNSIEKKTSSDQNLELFIDEESIMTEDTSAVSKDDQGRLFGDVLSTSSKDISREITMESDITQVSFSTESEGSRVIQADIETSQSTSDQGKLFEDVLSTSSKDISREIIMESDITQVSFSTESEGSRVSQAEIETSQSTSDQGKLFEDVLSTSSKDISREITMESDITQVSFSTESEGSRVIQADIETSQSTSETKKEQAGLKSKSEMKEQKSSQKTVDDTLMEKMKKFREEREEDVELFISEESETTSVSGESLSEVEKKKTAEEQKLFEEGRKQQKLKDEEEKRKKQIEEEKAAMLEKIKKFKKSREDSEEVNLFSGELEVTEESDQGQSVIIEESTSLGVSKAEGKKVEIEEFYSKETTVEGDIEVSREERKVFSFESEVSSQSFQEFTTEDDDSSTLLFQASVDNSALETKDAELLIDTDVAIEDVAIHEEEERLNAKNKKLSDLEQARRDESESQLKISSKVMLEATSKDSETVIKTETFEEETSFAESRRRGQAEPTTESSQDSVTVSVEGESVSASQADLGEGGFVISAKISTDENSQRQDDGIETKPLSLTSETDISENSEKAFEISAEIETEKNKFRDEKDELKNSSDVDGVAYGEKAELITDGSSVTGKVQHSNFSAKESTAEISVETTSALSETENQQESREEDVERAAIGAKVRPKLTAEASVGEDETDLIAVVDVKETQTETAHLQEIGMEKPSLGIQSGIVSQAEEDVLAGDSVVSIVIQDEDRVTGTQTVGFQSEHTNKGSQGELKSDVLTTETAAEDVSDISEAQAKGARAVAKDLPGVAEGIKGLQEEFKTALQEERIKSESATGVDGEESVLANQSEAKSESSKASKSWTEYQVESEESTSENVSAFGKECKVESKIEEGGETKMLFASTNVKESTQAAPETTDVDLQITEDLEHSVKASADVDGIAEGEKYKVRAESSTETKVAESLFDLQITEDLEYSVKASADVDGIAEGEKHKVRAESSTETKVAESLFDSKDVEMKDLSETQTKALGSETLAQDKAKKGTVESQVAEQTTDDVTENLGSSALTASEKALEISAELSVEAKTKDTEETKVEVLSSVESMKYSSTVEEMSSVDVSVLEETHISESVEKLVVTSETSSISSSEETPQISTEVFMSESKKSEEELSLDIQVDVSTESKTSQPEPEKAEEEIKISAEADVDSKLSEVKESTEVSVSVAVEETRRVEDDINLEVKVDTQKMTTEPELLVTSEIEPVQEKEELSVSVELEEKTSQGAVTTAEADGEVVQKPKQLDLSVTAEVETTEDKEGLSVSVSVDSSEKPSPKDTDELTFSASVETTEESTETLTLETSVEVQEAATEKELPSVSAAVEEVTADVSIHQAAETKSDEVSAEIDIPAEEEKAVPSAPEIEGPADISVETGQTINIEVTISGFPEPKVSWTKDFGRVEESKNIKMSANANVYSLQVLNTVKGDAGKYRVTATNTEGRATFDVKVKVSPAKEAAPKKDEVKKVEKGPPKIVAPADVTVECGQTLNVEINVTGNPLPRVSWYKDGKPVYPNYKTKTSVNGDVYSLQILNTVEADAGCYRAVAVNQKGEESCNVMVTITLPAPPQETSTGEDTETSVTIKEAEPEIGEQEPIADKEVEVVVDIQEKSKPTDLPSVSAEVEVSTDLKSPEDQKPLISANVEVEQTQLVKEKEPTEDVSAKVSIEREPETKSDEVSAEIDIPAEEEKRVPSAPEIDGPADISVEAGQTINIEVTISGFPEPKVSWTKDFGRVEESKNIKMSANANVYCLQVLNTVKGDAGKYRVTATNTEGRATFDVKVKVNPAKEAAPKKDEVKKVEKGPPKIVAPADVTVECGQTLNVEINVTGNPPPRVSWYKDGKPVYPNYKTKTNINGDVYSLQILNTVEADAGCYRAVAVNQKGEESCNVMVTITLPASPQETSTGEDTETSVTIKDAEPEVAEEEPIADKEVEVIVDIQEKGKPTDLPSVSAEVEASTDLKSTEDLKPLISANVEVEETQLVKEKEPTEDVSAKVSIEREPETKSDEVSAEIDIPAEEEKPVPSAPEIDGPADISVESGQTVNIEVTISGFPEPKVSWTKDFGRVEESKNIKMSVNANVYCLQVLNTVKENAGKYRVTATNAEGRATFDVKVKVNPAKEAAPKKDEVKSGKPEKAPPQIVAPADVTVEVGQTLNVEITVTGNPSPRVSWSKDGKAVYPNYRTKTNINGDVYSLQILNTVEADAGCYRATAVNQKGEESCNVMVTITLPAPPQETSTGEDTETSVTLKEMEPPELSTKPDDKSVTEGEPVTLSATVTGRPFPTVTWFKNDILLRSGYNCRLYKQGRSHFVEIPSAEIFDAGNYSLCVENPAGAVFWSIRVDVEAATEQESSGSTVGEETVFVPADMKDKSVEETPDEIFLKEYVMLSDFKDDATDFGLKEKETVEILDTVNPSKWLIRKQDDKEKVCYVPVELMRSKSESSDAPLKVRKRSLSRKMSEDGGASSGEEDTMKTRELFPLFVAVADYTPPDGDTISLKLSEGQFVEVLDMDNTEKWLVRTKPTKSTSAKQGWVPSSYLEEKDLKSPARSSSFREDIIKIKNKQQEALVKRRYVLTDLLEKEREYVNQLKKMTECFHDNMYKERNIPALLKDKKDTIFANLKEIQEFHSKVLLPALTSCTMSPASVGKIFLNKKDDFIKYIPYGCGRDNAEHLLSADEVKTFLQDYNRKSGCEQVLPECLRRPINRLHEYQTVLKDILKYTSRAGEDCTDIEGAIHMLAEILRRMDDLHLLSKVEDFPGDIAALGPLLRHDVLQLWEDDPEGRGKERHVFLFPDKMLFTKVKKDGKGFVHKSTSELQDIQINETVPSDNRKFELWYAEPTSEKLTLQTRNDIGKQAWTKDVREALKKLGIEETDISPEQQRRSKKAKSPSPAVKPTDKTSPAKELQQGQTTEEDYISFDSLDSDVSSYHTAQEFDDGSTLPFFKKRLRKTVVKEGEKVKLECTVGGKPLPTVAWQKGVYPIRNSDDLRIEIEGAYNALVIPDTIREDSGVYTAKASNLNGSAVCSAEVKVGGGDQSTDQEYKTAQSALSSDGEVTLPAKMGQMDSCVVEEGRMARFDCNLVAEPKPEIIWLKDGKILTSSKKYEVLNPREDLHSLIVNDVRKDDSGRYVCWARNEFGEAFTEAYLNIIPSKEAEVEVERIAPKITKKFYDVVVVNGKDAEVKFRFIGSPAPHIQFYVKNKEILPPRDYEINVDGDQCTFTLKEVSMEDAGKLIVKLTNPVGEASCSSQLTVVVDFSKPKTLPKVAPKFITRFTDVDVNEGFEARFKSKVTGEPIPTVTWLRNGLPVKDCSRYKYEQYGEIFIFIIENAEAGDAGEYTCQASNKAGQASCKANLAVTKVKIPQVSDYDGVSAYKSYDYGHKSYAGLSSKKDLKGANGEMGPQFGYAPVFTKMIQDCDTKEGRWAEFQCRAYGMPEPSACWTHNGVPLERGPRFIMSKDEESNYHLMIKDVLPSDAGQYSCKLSNFAGRASCSAELRVEALPRKDLLRLSPERGVDEEVKVQKKVIPEPPSMPDQKPVLLDKMPGSVRISWLPAHVPIKSPSSQPVMYIVESRELPGGDWRRMASKISDSMYTAKGLNPNAEYLFRVRAENDNGMSAPTQPAVLEMRAPKVKKPEKDAKLEGQKGKTDMMGLSVDTAAGFRFPTDKPTLLDIRPESVRIQWIPVTVPGPGSDYKPVKYLLEMKEIPGPWRKLEGGLSGNSYFATDLNPDREYNFRVRAENKFGQSEPTLPATLPRGRVVPPALKPYKPYASDFGAESLRLSWQPADVPKELKGVSPTSYKIEVQELPKQDWQTLVSYIPDTSYRLTDLRPEQDYNFRIRAENEFGLSEPSRPFYLQKALTYPGTAVTRPDIVELEPSAVRLNWQRVEIPKFELDEEPLTYMIEGRTPASDWRELVRGVRGTSHYLSGLDLHDDYSFRVRPDLGPRGLGDPSPPMALSRALARTRIPVSDLEIEELEPTSARLRWDRVHIPPFDSFDEPLLYMIECQEGPYANWRTLATGVPTTSFRVSDLAPEKDYAFRVRAETEYGISEPSPPKPLYRKPLDSPRYHLEMPKLERFDADSLQLSWKPISPHPRIRRADPPKYTIEMQEAPQADWRPVAAGIPDTSFRLAGLRPEQDYSFRVRAETSRLPEPVALITPSVSLLRGGVPPVMPSTAPTISNEKPNSLRLSWRPANLPSYLVGDIGPIRYRVESQEGSSSEWRTLASRLAEPFFEVTQLHPQREYAFRVRAETESGASGPTAPVYLYRKPVPHLPKAEPLLSDIRPDSIRLTWQAVDVPGRVVDFQKVNYLIEMQEPPSQSWVPFVRDVHEINHRIQNLRPDKDYVFRVRAVTDQGMSEPTHSVYLPRRAVQPRLPISEPYISDVKPDSARLSWSPVDTPPYGAVMAPTTYRVEIQEPPNGNWQTLVRKLPTTNYLLTNLRPDKMYSLRVRAENDYGASEPTRAVQLPKRAVAPIVPRDIPMVADVRGGSMRLTWQPAHVPSYGGSTVQLPVTYTIEAREPGRDWTPLVRRIPHTSYFLSGLRPEGDYEFRVRAESQYGLSPPGPSTSLPRQQIARIPIQTPRIVDIQPDGRSLVLQWQRANIPSGTGAELITYVIEAQEPPSIGWSPVARGIMDTKYRISGLRPNQDYLFRVRAHTAQGLSEPTLPVTFYRRMISPRVPVERPQLYDLEPDAVRLSWQPTSTYMSETPLRYTVEVREPQIKKWRPLVKNLPDTSYHVTGLKPKLDYEFRVRPETDIGLLEPTPSIPLYRKRVLPPLRFEEPRIFEDEPESVGLRWQRVTVPRFDSGDEELTYMVEAQRGPTLDWQPIARNIRDTSYRVTGLGPYDDYQFRIRGESRDFGFTEPSLPLPLYRKPILPNVPISRPVIEDVDSTSVRLGWQRVQIPSFGGDDSPLTFMIEGQDAPGADWHQIARDIKDTRYQVRDLKPRQDYSFRIRGVRGTEISDPTPPLPVFRSPLAANWRPLREDVSLPSRPYFECLSIKVPPSMPIEKPILSDITRDSVGLTWRPARVPPNSSPALYNVEIRKLPNMNWQRLAGGLTMTTFKVSNLNPDRSYMFRIKAENEYGTSGSTMPASLGRPGVDSKKTFSDDDDSDQGYGQRATPRLPMDKPSVYEESPDVFAVSWSPARIPTYSKPSKIRYIIEKREPPSHDWLRVASNITDTRHIVKGLKPNKDIMFRIRAESDFGMSDPTLAAAVNRRPVPTSIPPRIKDVEEESLMLAPSTFISGSVGTATAPRAPTGRPVISEVQDTKLELSWFPARIPAYMKNTPVTYSVEIREPPSSAWAPLVSGLNETGHTVDNLKPNKDYMFRVKAENEHGASEPTLPAILEREPEPKPQPENKRMTPRPSPRSTPQRTFGRHRTPSMDRETTPLRLQSREATPLRYTSREPTPLRKTSLSGLPVPAELIAPFDSDIQYAVEGRQGQICLGLRGFPLPTIQWYFKGKPLENDEKYNAFISPAGEATLAINDVKLDDIGEYKCNAENEEGVAVKIVQLDVADPPTFIEPLKDLTIIAKSTGVLECRVDGIPYPEVKWSKDWRPLVESSRITIDHESPDYWNLTLNGALKSDGGLYACVAENIAGKVHCVANIIIEDQAPSKSRLNFKQANIEDHYHILEEKGRGRSSIVRRVIEKSTGKEFAAKFIQVRDPADKEIFRNELECLRLANHKNVAALQDAYETERRLVLVNELVSGPELLDKVVTEGAWTESDAAYFVKQLLDILKHLHSEGIVVVDLKPWDIQISSPGSDEIKLVDLGFARRLAASRDIRTSYGTAEFVAPEVIDGDPLTTAADVWSIGVIAYILLSGVSPFFNESERATLLTVQGADWDFDSKIFENVSKEARDFISKVLLKEPKERLTVSECLDHPWIKFSVKRGQGMKVNIDNLQKLNNRYKALRSATAVKTVVDILPLGKSTAGVEDSGLNPEVDPATGNAYFPDSQAYGEYLDEETWIDWQTRYQQGLGTQLLPLKETALPLRIREYKRQKERDTRSPSVESEIGEDRKMMKQRLMVSDVEAEIEPSPTRRKEFEWIVQPEEIKEKRRRTSSESESLAPKTVGVRTDEDKSSITHVGHHVIEAKVKGFSPIFSEKLKDMAYLVGEDVTFSCHVLSNLTPNLTWYRNEGMLSDGQRIRTSFTEDGRASLTILNTMPNDVGVYKCIVRNKLGTTTSKARLLLGDNPDRPGRPVVCAVSSDEALVIWDAPKSDGNSFINSYKVDCRKAGEDRWITSAFVLDECALIQNLKPSTIYRFRVSCLNKFGQSPFSWSSVEVRTKPPGAPKVVIDEEIERLLLRSRRALESPSPRESVIRSDVEILPTIDEEFRTSPLEEDYSVGDEIRKGGFSSIKCVSRKVGGDECVAKITPSDSTKKDEFIREFSVLKPLLHENIIRLVAGYQTPKEICLVMDRLYGDNVVEHLSFKNTYTEESVARIMRQVLDGLQYLHHAGIAHLNLQPSSVMLASRRRMDVKLVDFSLARTLTTPEGVHMPKIGFPDFISPEMVAQEKVGFAADLWSVGVLTFLLLSGESPFLAETDLETFGNIAYNRYDAQDLYENVTKEGLKFIYDVLKRLPRNRLGLEECLEHKWLQPAPNMVKARQDAVFLSNKLRCYAKDYNKKRQERAGVYIELTSPPPVNLRPKVVEIPASKEDRVPVKSKEENAPDVKEKVHETPEPKKEEPVIIEEQKVEPEVSKVAEKVVEKVKTPSPEPVLERKIREPSPVIEVKASSPDIQVEEKTTSASVEPVKEKSPPVEPPLIESPTEKSPEVSIQSPVEDENPDEGSEDTSEVVELESIESKEGLGESLDSSLYTTEEPISPMPGATPEREAVIENIEAIVDISEESSTTQQTLTVTSEIDEQEVSTTEEIEEVSVHISSTVDETETEVVSVNLAESEANVEPTIDENNTDITLTLTSEVTVDKSKSEDTKTDVDQTETSASDFTIDADVIISSETVESTEPIVVASVDSDITHEVTVQAAAEVEVANVEDESTDLTLTETIELAPDVDGKLETSEVESITTNVELEEQTDVVVESAINTSENIETEATVTISESEVSSQATALESVADGTVNEEVTVETNLTITSETDQDANESDTSVQFSLGDVNTESVVQESLSVAVTESTVSASDNDAAVEISLSAEASADDKVSSQTEESQSVTISSDISEEVTTEAVTLTLGSEAESTEASVEAQQVVVEDNQEAVLSLTEEVTSDTVTKGDDVVSVEVSSEIKVVEEKQESELAQSESKVKRETIESEVGADLSVAESGGSEEVIVSEVLEQSVETSDAAGSEITSEAMSVTDTGGQTSIFSSESVSIAESAEETSGSRFTQMSSSVAEDSIDIFGGDDDEDYFLKKRRQRAAQASVVAEEVELEVQEDDLSSRLSSRRSRRSARSSEMSGSEDSSSLYSEENVSSRSSRRSERSYEVSESSSSSRESRRSGWRSRLGDL